MYEMKDYTDKNLKKMFVSLSLIQALAAAIPSINTLISSFIIGNNFGTSALAAIGFAGPYSFFISAFVQMIGNGSQLLCSEYIGAGHNDGINKTFNTSIILGIAAGGFLALISALFSSEIACVLGAEGEIRIMTADYIRGYAICSFCSVFSMLFLSYLQLDLAKSVSTATIIIQVVLNIVLNIVNAEKLHWGMFGVGLAASVSCLISVCVSAIHLAFKSKLFCFSFRSFSYAEMKKIITCGYNAALVFIWLVLRDRMFNSVLFSVGGAVAMSAFTIASNVANSFGGTLQGSIEAPCRMLASIFIGERDISSLRRLQFSLPKTVWPFSVCCYLVICLAAKPICLAFGADPANIAIYVMILRLFNLYYITNPIKTNGISIYNAMKNSSVVSVLNFLSLFVYPCVFFILGKMQNSIPVLFLFAVGSEVLIVISLKIYYVMKGHSLFSLNYVYIPNEIAVPMDCRYESTICSVDDAMKSSQGVIDFCKGKGLDKKKSYFCGLCIEEVCVDILSRNTGKECSVDVRIIFENSSVHIMLRDSCNKFDVSEWLKLYAKDNPARSMGLKMVSSLSKTMNYKSTLGMNVLTIEM